jgi:uncharacterized protein (TIGR04255 family)
MSPRHHYSQAPITEALIDIRVQLPGGVGLDRLERLHEDVRPDYPGKARRSLAKGRFGLEGKQVSASASSEPAGFLFKSSDAKQIVQVRLDGFTMSRLAPYENWEPFRDEARRLWRIYRSELKPSAVIRLAVRYINRIDIPLPFDDLKTFLRTVPEVSPAMPQALSGLFMQLTIPQADIDCTMILTEALIDPSRPGVASVILDIDLFRPERVPQDEHSLWECFELLHDRKNQIFEACITEETRKLIR